MQVSAPNPKERVSEPERNGLGDTLRPSLPSVEHRSHAPAPLFRAEVLVEHQSQWLGTVLLEPRVTHRVYACLALLSAAAILGLLFFTSYTRKAHISGWLVPQHGLARVFAPQAGVVTQLQVREGMVVKKGAPLLTISTELRSETIGATRHEIIRHLQKRRLSVIAEKTVHEQLFAQQGALISQKITALRDEQQYLAREVGLQRSRMQLSQKVTERTRSMRARDVVPQPRLDEAEQELLEQEAKLQNLQRTQVSLQRDLAELEGSLRELPLKRSATLGEVDRQIATLEQELAEAESRREVVITAPYDGTVAGLQAEIGGGTQPNVPLMNIVPEGSRLQAQLFSPSSAVGFVHEGQRVMLRYAAFPYQKFGMHEGVVASLSRSAISPSEMTQRLSGLTALYGANEPVYQITVDLKSQSVNAYGNLVPLQPGMQLEADVLLEKRRLIEWMLEPLLTLTGKWSE